MSIDENKLITYLKSLNFQPSDRKPNRSLRSTEKYNPKPALNDLQVHLNDLTKQLKSGAISGADIQFSLQSQDYIVQKDPYTSVAKVQFEEGIRADGIVQRSLLRKADFVFAKGIRTVLDTMWDDEQIPPQDMTKTDLLKPADPKIKVPQVKPELSPYVKESALDTTKDPNTKNVPKAINEIRAEVIQQILGNKEYVNAKRQIDKVNKRCNIRNAFRAAYLNCKGFGRSALLIEEYESPDTYPTSLYIMNSKLLGNVYCDKKTNRLAYIEYNSNDSSNYNNKIFYEPDDIIYFTNFDYHISPNTLYYGLSEIEPVKDISETNRILDEEDYKEWARSLWAGIILFTLPNLHNEGEVETLLDKYNPGKPVAITSDITAQMLKIADGLADGIDLHLQGDRRILRAFGMPSFTIGFEDVTNRATTQFILHAWKETFIEQERILVKDVVEKQWINPMWAKALNMTIDEIEDIEAKLTLEFIEYNFDTFSQQVDAWLPLVQAGYISVEDFLEKIGEDELAQKYKTLKKQLVEQGYVPNVGQMKDPNQFGGGGGGFGKPKGVPNDPTENQGGSSKQDEGTSVRSGL